MSWLKAQTLEERLQELRHRRPSAFSYKRKEAKKRVAAWKRLSAFSSDETLFSHKLQILACSESEFLRILGTSVELLYADDYQPCWALAIETALREGAPKNQSSPALTHYLERGLIAPFYKILYLKSVELRNRMVQINDLPHYFSLLEIGEKLEWSFLQTFEYNIRRTVILELNSQRLLGQLPGENESEQFVNFVESFESINNCLKFLKKYPVLARYASTTSNFWLETSIEFVSRLNCDWHEVCEVFGLDKQEEISEIKYGGDSHCGGRNVCIISFKSGKKLIYKPRNLGIDIAFAKLLKWLNSFESRLDFKTIKILNKGSHGWAEFIEFVPTKNSLEKENFYFRLGALSAVLYLTNSVDIFFENLIAHGEFPVIVDFETLFHTDLEKKTPSNLAEAIDQFLRSSVMSLSIFPKPSLSSDGKSIFDVSAIGASKDLKAPYFVTGIENFGRADMHIKRIPGWIPEAKNNPGITNINEIPSVKLLEGFEVCYRIFEEKKAALLSSSGLFASFRELESRVIVRDTLYYGSLQTDSFHPDLLRDALDQNWHWDNIWNGVLSRPNLVDFISSELKQIEKFDIPHFSTKISTNKIFDSDGYLIQHAENLSGWNQALDKLQSASPRNREEQLKLIRLSLGFVGSIQNPNANFLVFKKNNDYEGTAIEVGDYVVDQLIWHEGNASFIKPRNILPQSQSNSLTLEKADNSFYDGTTGVSFFLAYLGLMTSNQIYIDAAQALTNTAISEYGENSSISGFLGLGSLVYLLTHLSKIKQEEDLFEEAFKILPKINDSIISDKNFDILSGSAGCILSLLPLMKATSSSKVHKTLAKCGDHLLNSFLDKEMTSSLEFQRGFSHGLSGIALALFSLPEQKYHELALELIRKENQLLSEGKWTDNHQLYGRDQVSWCHGAPGIALARLRISEIHPNELVNINLKEALEETKNHLWLDSHCLCHGTLGNIQALAYSENISQWSKYGVDSRDALDRVHKIIKTEGWNSLTNDQSLNIGLMIGISGLGYAFLQEAYPDVIPLVLIMEGFKAY